MSDCPVCSVSEQEEVFYDISYEYDIPEGYTKSDIKPEIEVVSDEDEHICYLTKDSDLWCTDTAQEVFRKDLWKAKNYKNSYDYFIACGWNCQPDDLYIVDHYATKEEAEDSLNAYEGWGD